MHIARSSLRPLRQALSLVACLALACAPAREPASRPEAPAGRPEAPAGRPDAQAAPGEPWAASAPPRLPAAAPPAKARRAAADGPARPAPVALSPVLASRWRAGAWLQDRADPRGTGATDTAPVRGVPRVLWRYVASAGAVSAGAAPAGSVMAGPVVAGEGNVYLGTSTGRVLALDVATGKERWSRAEKGGVLAAPALHPGPGGGTLYAVLADTGTLVAFKASSGERLYDRVVGGPALGAPLLAEGRIYLGSGAPGVLRGPGAIHSLEAATGKPLWRRATGIFRLRTVKRNQFLAGVSARPALSADGVVYATSQDGFLHAVDGRTGKSRQREMIERLAAYTPAIDGKLAFFHRGGQIFFLGRPGKILGMFTRPPKPLAKGLGSPALTAARIYVAGDGALVATGREASAPKWSYPLPAQTTTARHSAPVVAGAGTAEETAYVVDAQGILHAVDGASGRGLWTFSVARPGSSPDPLRAAVFAAPAFAAPALLPHLILVSTPQGEIIALTDAR